MDTQVLIPQVGFVSSRIAIATMGPRHFVDLTEQVQGCLDTSNLRSGLLVVTTLHTTAALLINEHEPELLKDLDELLTRLAPQEYPYAHNGVPAGPGEQPNGHAHCQALLLQASVTIPVVGGQLSLGRYQRIFLVELDRPRPRQISVSMLGT